MKSNIFKIRSVSMLLAVFCAIAWAMAFPLIKIGFNAFSISANDTAGKTLFAGIRFFLAGLIVMLIGKMSGRSFAVKSIKDKLIIFLFGLVNTAFHYFFFYMGLSRLSGSRSAIIDSLGTFLLIILSCILFKDDKFTLNKIIGCVLGLGGIILINADGSDLFSGVSLMGDGMLVLSALCAATGGLLTRIAAKKTDPVAATGISLTIGGALLIVTGILCGGKITQINLTGIIALIMLVIISASGFAIYNQLICYNPVSKIAIFNSLIPILGIIFSCVILGEAFSVKYIVAGIIVSMGIVLLEVRS